MDQLAVPKFVNGVRRFASSVTGNHDGFGRGGMARRAVVSGGGTGIGKAVARRLAADGCSVVVVGRRAGVLEDAAAEIRAELAGAHVSARAADLTDPGQVGELAAALAEDGPVDVLVNNAGGNFAAGGGDDLAAVAAAWEADVRGNVLPAVLLTTALLPSLARPGGRVVVMSSIAALRGPGTYGGSKAALHAWAMGLAGRVAADGVTVNVVAPGFVPDTEFWSGRLTDELVADRVGQIPAGRPGTPREVAAAVAYLAAPDAGWTTGQIVQVNGGTLLGRG
jgi:3-oxoacyl-[acyl-carrier protein] reductase